MAGVYIAIQAVLTLYAQGTVPYIKLNITDILQVSLKSSLSQVTILGMYRENGLYTSCSKLSFICCISVLLIASQTIGNGMICLKNAAEV